MFSSSIREESGLFRDCLEIARERVFRGFRMIKED